MKMVGTLFTFYTISVLDIGISNVRRDNSIEISPLRLNHIQFGKGRQDFRHLTKDMYVYAYTADF